MKLPLPSRFGATVTGRQIEQAGELAIVIGNEHPQLRASDSIRHLIVDSMIDDEPTLYLADFSEIPVINVTDDSPILQQRARLRATDGDFVAQTNKVEKGFSDYCEYTLGLGRVHWLYPSTEPSDTCKIAFECWQDRRVRHDLIHAVRHKGLRYIHPYLSTTHVWELGAMLQTATRRPIKVIGPTPAMAHWANDKIEFSRAAARLLGPQFVPHTESAYNFATLSKKVARLATTHAQLGIKFPYGTGGHGNFLIDAARIRGQSLSEVREYLKNLLLGHRWPKKGRVLIDVWETDVIMSPSVQTWIPPLGGGYPLIDGLFQQSVKGDKGVFAGSRPLRLPSRIEQEIINSSYLLAILFQQLGYVGRCSFDLILVGEDVENCRVEFVECNARWGGTSIPMTLLNRLRICEENTYGTCQIEVAGLDQLEFSQLLRELNTELYSPQTGKGRLILFNPARLKALSGIDSIAIGGTMKQVNELLHDVFPVRLKEIVRRHLATGKATKTSLISRPDQSIKVI